MAITKTYLHLLSNVFTLLSINPSESNLSIRGGGYRERVVAGGNRKQNVWRLQTREETFIIFSRSVASSLIKVAAERNQQRAH